MKQALLAAIEAAKATLDDAQKALSDFEQKAENNVFATMEEAERKIEMELFDQARNDCEGSHNCGADHYDQEFIVDGVVYVGTLTVEYNRHDKKYYYVDESEFSVAKK